MNDLLRTRLSCRCMIWLLAHLPAPISRSQVVSLSQSSYMSPVELTNGRGGRSEGGAKSYNHEKAWSSIYYPILSGKNVHHSFLDLTIFAVLNTVYMHCTLCPVWTTQHDKAIQCQKRKLKVWWPNAYIFIFLLQYNIHTFI